MTLPMAISLLAAATSILSALGVLRYRKTMYSAGWVDGRLAMLQSMVEAQGRGIPADEWAKAEARRDYANHSRVLGKRLPPELEDEQ